MDVAASAIAAGPTTAANKPEFFGDKLPAQPIEKPLIWNPMADAFEQCVMNPRNRVLRTRPDGTRYFTSALEADEDGGLTTFGPLVLGKILRGDRVGEFLPSLGAYFNEDAGIFLDGHNADLCEYWYLMNINAMAAAITRTSLPHDAAAWARVRRSANRLMEIAHQVEYNFNEQGYRFNKRVPFTNEDRFRQPDTVGGYAYAMLLAYEMFGDHSYLDEAKIGLIRYQSFTHNPWYEIPSGAMACLAAARLSLLDRAIDPGRAFHFALDSKEGPMHTGAWNGREVNGLMQGFHSEPADEAYNMESMVGLPYLLPMVRYRPEFAASVGRYALNVAANLRWFYPHYLPPNQQSRPDLMPAVPYERIDKVHDGLSPYALGDYKSHRSIYGGAYSLWWAALVQPTSQEYIVRLNVSKSDFLAGVSYPTYLYYNPGDEGRVVSLYLGRDGDRGTVGEAFDVYDLSEHRYWRRNVHESPPLHLMANTAKIIVAIPAGKKSEIVQGVLKVASIPVDYHAAE